MAGYAYHESLFHTAVEMRPTGRAEIVDNPDFTPPSSQGGPAYIVMKSRGRDTKPASAVDIVVPRGATIQAPVDGVVVDASAYLLYCHTPDHRVVIQPSQRPNWRVVIFHLANLRVHVGNTVEAGRTELGRPHVFVPHSAEYDEYINGGLPHVHVEVEDRPVIPTPCVQ